MKTLLMGGRKALNQRIASLLSRSDFEVREAMDQEEVVEILAQERFDLLLLVAPDDEAEATELVASARDTAPSLDVFCIAAEGALTNLVPRMHPVLGKQISVNDLPIALRDAVMHAEVEREMVRLEWLRFAEELLETVSSAPPGKETAQRLVSFVHETLRCDGALIALAKQPDRDASVAASAGDAGGLSDALKQNTTIYQWIVENQAPLLIRRGRSGIPGIQREVVKHGLGPSMLVPITTSQGTMGMVAVTRKPDADPFTDSAFLLLRMAARTFAMRLSGGDGARSDEYDTLQEELADERLALRNERQWRESLEDALTDEQERTRRLARELGELIDRQKGYGPEAAQEVAKLSLALAEQIGARITNLEEAIYLRDIGLLAVAEQTDPNGPRPSAEELVERAARPGFEVLSRVGVSAACLEVALHHRENYDGSGVPDHLAADAIPLSARIVRIVEDYVDMTGHAGGTGPASSSVALAYISREAGRLYDPNLANAFVSLMQARGVTPDQQSLSLIAHELRTPLTFLVGFSELLAARDDMPDQAKAMASELHKQTEQMVSLTERLLELTRLQSGRVSLTWEGVHLRELLEDQITKGRALTSKHTFRAELPDSPVRIRADATRVSQLVSNLLTNAVKYSPNGGEVRVRLEDAAREVTVSVTDQGIGIPEEKAGQLFQPFYRVEQAEVREVEGLGLGLALCKAVVEAHGGRIWVDSKPGRGTTVSFTLPKREVTSERNTPARPGNQQ